MSVPNQNRMKRGFQIALLLAVVFSLLPFALVWLIYRVVPSPEDISRHIANVNPSIGSDVLSAIAQGVVLFFNGLVYMIMVIIGAALLFDVTWKRKKIIQSRSPWQVYLGYLLTVTLLVSMFASEILHYWAKALWGTARAPTLTLLVILLGLTVFVARIMSKLPIKVEDTNLGSFIMVIYVSYAIFKILSEGFNPFILWSEVLRTELIPSYANAFFLLFLPAIFSFVLMLLDVFVIKRIADGKL